MIYIYYDIHILYVIVKNTGNKIHIHMARQNIIIIQILSKYLNLILKYICSLFYKKQFYILIILLIN